MTGAYRDRPREEPLRCPRDGSQLAPEKYEANIEVDVCPKCHGMWLDKGELEAIQETTEHDYTKALSEESGVAPRSIEKLRQQQKQEPIDCPICATRLDNREYGYSSQIMIDTCTEGCGVWLDEGEIQQLEKFFERNRDNKTLPVHWRVWASVLSVFKKR